MNEYWAYAIIKNSYAQANSELRYHSENRSRVAGVEESVAWGTPVLKVHGKIFAGIAIHSSAEPGSLMVRMAPEDRDELISAAPEVYYVTDHYVQGNGVLVRLSRVNADVLRDLIGMSHKYVLASVVGASRYPKPEKVRRNKRSR